MDVEEVLVDVGDQPAEQDPGDGGVDRTDAEAGQFVGRDVPADVAEHGLALPDRHHPPPHGPVPDVGGQGGQDDGDGEAQQVVVLVVQEVDPEGVWSMEDGVVGVATSELFEHAPFRRIAEGEGRHRQLQPPDA